MNRNLLILFLVLIPFVFAGCRVFSQESGVVRPVSSSSPQETPSFDRVETKVTEDQVKIALVGDVMLARSVMSRMITENDWKYPFLETQPFLSSADLTFGNLESPFGVDCSITNEGMRFCARPESVVGLTDAGFDVMSLANNHTYDQGEVGLQLSEQTLEQNNIMGIVQGEIEYTQVQDVTIAWLAYNAITGDIDLDEVATLITQAKQNADVVFVSMHWGWEYTAEANPYQVTTGRALIDLGADVVIGHHPHWIQPIEEYKEGLIIYSLGNFVFDQMWSEETRLGEIVTLTVDKQGYKDYSTQKVKIFDYAQPRLLAED